MSSYNNFIVISGKIYDIKKIEFSNKNGEKGILYFFLLTYYQGHKGKYCPEFLKLYCELWNKKIGETLKDGDIVNIIGNIKQICKEKNGSKKIAYHIEVNTIHILEKDMFNEIKQN